MVIGLVLALFLQTPAVLWDDDDRQSIPEPKEREISIAYDFFTGTVAYPFFQTGDMPRNFRKVVGKPKQAENINSVDEVPNSSWYTNRNFLHPMTLEDIARGPNTKPGPANGPLVVEQCKVSGVTPGLRIIDSEGDRYFIKFDPLVFPDLTTAADVIGSKIFYAAGYNVPANSIAYFDPAMLKIKEGLECRNADDVMVPLDQQALDRILSNVGRTEDGKVRALASLLLKGTPKGPFSYVGWRDDDPNDVIAHEHRRELRGLRVISAFINHNDVKQLNTLDVYVEEDGRKFLKHHFIDFGATLGSATLFQKLSSEGYEHVLDSSEIFKKTFSLGIYGGRDVVEVEPLHPSLGYLEGATFKPKEWKPNTPIASFENMTDLDGYWGAKIVASFTDDQLRAIIRSGSYSDPVAEEKLFAVLAARRDRIAEHWFSLVAPLDRFRVADGKLMFDDLARDGKYDKSANLQYEVEIDDGKSTKKITIQPGSGIPIPAGANATQFTIRRIANAWPELEVQVKTVPRNGTSEVIEVKR